jgi:hypothetical protein
MTDHDFAAAARECPADESLADEFFALISSSYEAFVRAVWINRKLYHFAPLADIELDMVRFAGDTTHRRRGVLALRGFGKTYLITATYSCFKLRRDPQRKILIVSKSGPAAKDTVGLIKAWINSIWFLEDLRPLENPRGTDKWRRDNKNAFDVGPAVEHKQASVTAIGVDGQLEGNRAHTIIPDDCETKGNTKTVDARDELEKLTNEFTNILYPDRTDATTQAAAGVTDDNELIDVVDPVEILYVGTPKHEDTLYLKRIAQGYRFQSYPIILPRQDERVISLAPYLHGLIDAGAAPGTPTTPHRFGPTEIADRQKGGYTEFAMEFMLIADLASTNRHPLRLADLIVYPTHRDKAPVSIAWGTRDHNGSTACSIQSLGLSDDRLHGPIHVDQQWCPFDRTAAAIDPAGRGIDKTGLAIGGALAGILWVKYAKGIPGGVDDFALDQIAETLRTHNATELFLETNIDAFGTFQATIERALARHRLEPGANPLFPAGWSCTVTPIRNQGQKELRIIGTLEPIFSAHRAVFDPSVFDPPADDQTNDLQYQITRLTKDRKCLPEDGVLDALEMLARHTVGPSMAIPVTAQAQDAQIRYFSDMIAKHRRSMGQAPDEPSWFDRV